MHGIGYMAIWLYGTRFTQTPEIFLRFSSPVRPKSVLRSTYLKLL